MPGVPGSFQARYSGHQTPVYQRQTRSTAHAALRALGTIFCGVCEQKRAAPRRGQQALAAAKRAGDRTRTDDSHLGKVALYQLSYTRVSKLLILQMGGDL